MKAKKNNLQVLRKRHKLSVRDLAIKVNINSSTLNRIENEETSFNNEYIDILTRFFDVSADYLLGLSDIPNPEPHKFHYYSESNNLLTIEDIIDKYKHSNISIVFAPEFIKVRFDNDPEKSEIKYTRVK